MGGNEITSFAGMYPERVAGLIYLDACHELSDPGYLHELSSALGTVAPEAPDLASLQAYRDWPRVSMFGQIPWTPGLEAFMRDTTVLGPDASVAPRMSGSLEGALFDSVARAPRDYASVRAPALALYASSFFPVRAVTRGKAEVIEGLERRVMDPFREDNIERIRREPHAQAQLIPEVTHMSIGVHDTAALAEIIGSFLLSPTTGAAKPQGDAVLGRPGPSGQRQTPTVPPRLMDPAGWGTPGMTWATVRRFWMPADRSPTSSPT
jgi:pimeloyl-ACP methyl ester carboxylesterase